MDLKDYADGVVDHEYRKTLEEKARKDAETGSYNAPHIIPEDAGYCSSLLLSAVNFVYAAAYVKRLQRIERIANRTDNDTRPQKKIKRKADND